MGSEKIRMTPARFVSRVRTHEVAGHMVQRSVRSIDRQHDQSRRGRNTVIAPSTQAKEEGTLKPFFDQCVSWAIVFGVVSDAVGIGLLAGLSHPGGM